MFVVLFEVQPRAERFDEYLAIAGGLRPELERIPGFVENVRWRSLGRPGWLLSVSTWRDEAALIAWRRHAGHHLAQRRGREAIFRDYRIRVGAVAGAGTVTAAETDGDPGAAAGAPGLLAADVFEALLTPGRHLLLRSWDTPVATPAPQGGRAMAVRVLRDYGMRARTQAPQAFPPAPDEEGPAG